MITKEIIKELEKEFPKNLAEEWDNVGLLVGDNKREIKKLFFKNQEVNKKDVKYFNCTTI